MCGISVLLSNLVPSLRNSELNVNQNPVQCEVGPTAAAAFSAADSVVRPWARGVKLVEELEKVDGLAMEEQAKVVGSTMGELATVDLVVAVRGSARKKEE